MVEINNYTSTKDHIRISRQAKTNKQQQRLQKHNDKHRLKSIGKKHTQEQERNKK